MIRIVCMWGMHSNQLHCTSDVELFCANPFFVFTITYQLFPLGCMKIWNVKENVYVWRIEYVTYNLVQKRDRCQEFYQSTYTPSLCFRYHGNFTKGEDKGN
eukprot:78716_1